VVHEDAEGLLGDAGDLAAQLVGEAVEELLGEERHVLPAIAQRREVGARSSSTSTPPPTSAARCPAT
jgi:hypothetical protein